MLIDSLSIKATQKLITIKETITQKQNIKVKTNETILTSHTINRPEERKLGSAQVTH